MAAIQLKGFDIRATVGELRDRGLYELVRARVSADTRAVLDDPPPVTAWLDARHQYAVHEALLEILGTAGLKEFAHKTIARGFLAYVKTVVHGMLRLFGTAPEVLFARLNLVLGATLRGVEIAYVPESRTSGRLQLRPAAGERLPYATLVVTAGAFEVVFELCDRSGTIVPLADQPWGHELHARWV